jgi:hypothetical protein
VQVLVPVSTNTHSPFNVTYITNATYYSFVTNATFYDYRENDTVKAIQIDVGKLMTWLTNNVAITTLIGATNIVSGGTNRGGYQYNQMNVSGGITGKGHNINAIYVYNSIPPASGSPGTLPAVRLINGAQLPSTSWFGNGKLAGLTVSSAQPFYVLGNYNVTNNGAVSYTLGSTVTGGAVPAALIADALTILSTNWSDANNASTYTRNAAQTTVNAATMEGIVPSVTVNGNQQYSGGVENFLRMEESWTGVPLTYNGSIVVLFPSQYATNYWPGTGVGQSTPNVYNPPVRNWGFDLNFLKGQSAQPPCSPQFKQVIRSSYIAN